MAAKERRELRDLVMKVRRLKGAETILRVLRNLEFKMKVGS